MIVIEWADVPGAFSYNVYKAATSVGPFVLLTNVPGTSYQDGVGLITNFYQVAAVDQYGTEGPRSGTLQQFAPPANTCKVFGTVIDSNGNPEENALVEVFVDPSDTFQFVQGSGLTEDDLIMNTSNLGKFEIYTPIGALVRLRIQKMGVELQFAVPNQATLNIKDIVGVVGVRKPIFNPF